tara:strand:- start:37 stop:240 length:204 start_codon:yes stop_codon:yes gene_type:complete
VEKIIFKRLNKGNIRISINFDLINRIEYKITVNHVEIDVAMGIIMNPTCLKKIMLIAMLTKTLNKDK